MEHRLFVVEFIGYLLDFKSMNIFINTRKYRNPVHLIHFEHHYNVYCVCIVYIICTSNSETTFVYRNLSIADTLLYTPLECYCVVTS